MWSRKRLDIGWTDLLYAAMRSCLAVDDEKAARRVERLWPEPRHMLACLSVRSAFDLLLGELALPRGSEVLMSAITIADMVRIVEHHGLVPVPVDLDLAMAAPTEEAWRRAITPATRAAVVAHLFGARTDLEPLAGLAREHGFVLIEDCAQAFEGTEWAGHAQADASLFSFGTIKSCTAMGGAVVRVRDLGLLGRMRAAQAAWPRQSRRSYLGRVAKCAVLKALSGRGPCGLLIGACRVTARDYDRWVNKSVRGFPGPGLIRRIRRRPSTALLDVLARRLQRFDARRLAAQQAKGKMLNELLRGRVLCPGGDAVPHSYWVFPVIVKEPQRLIERLARRGFDATQGQSLCVVPPPVSRPEAKAASAKTVLDRIVFLPFYAAMPGSAVRRMAEVTLAEDVPETGHRPWIAASRRRFPTGTTKRACTSG